MPNARLFRWPSHESLLRRKFLVENQTLETRNPPMKAGRCPGKAGEYQGLSNLIIPENSIRRKSHFWLRRSFVEIVRAPSAGLDPEGETFARRPVHGCCCGCT